ncbi:GroES-like protein [Coniophora puteana RWD-64-598 SS2]|uniref:GroES-like protein n=1 Tax=Coniophora puteana (strain RWD-64-598) TaxID=741705 RepID=A0A5M3MDQ0_CONPW|nr:GroES-like protein [Coniophora puteana RWD-64-598 SS2]EIW77116.1 GroES-like protein [Coniophora puteana RWD-64-598 SS2]
MSQKALFLKSKQGAFELGTRDIPKPGHGDVLVKSYAVSLNPIDWKIQAYGLFLKDSDYPAVLGQGTAGVVEEVGAGVTHVSKGDRVFSRGDRGKGVDHSGYQQYVIAGASFVAKIPESISFDEAASIPTGADTAAAGLFGPKDGNLAFPDKPDAYKGQTIVVLGGSSSVGLFVIQAARLAGFSTIITTSSLTHEGYLKSLGATHVIDRHLSPDQIAARIKATTSDAVKIVYDAISEADTQKTAWAVLAPGGHLVLTLPSTIQPEAGETRTIKQVFGSPYLADNNEVGKKWWAKLPEWLSEGKIKPNKVEVVSGGLGGTAAGLERLKANKVSGVKLIVRPFEGA